MSDNVKMKALDSFHSGPTGMVHARAEFETHEAHAAALENRGLAERIKKAPAAQNKMAPAPENKMAAAPANKAAAKEVKAAK